MRLIVGIDIGACSAIALLDAAGALIDVQDMPTLQDGPKGRRAVNGALLAALVYKWQPDRAFVEYVGARPGEGAVGAFAFGRSKGVVEGVLAACGIAAAHIAPAAWKRAVGLSLANKDAARAEAIRRWPKHAEMFARVKDDGRVKAALIGVTGLLKGGAP